MKGCERKFSLIITNYYRSIGMEGLCETTKRTKSQQAVTWPRYETETRLTRSRPANQSTTRQVGITYEVILVDQKVCILPQFTHFIRYTVISESSHVGPTSGQLMFGARALARGPGLATHSSSISSRRKTLVRASLIHISNL